MDSRSPIRSRTGFAEVTRFLTFYKTDKSSFILRVLRGYICFGCGSAALCALWLIAKSGIKSFLKKVKNEHSSLRSQLACPVATCRVPLLLLIFCKRRFKAYLNKVRSGPGKIGILE
jgi:hypothetical protein